MKMSSDKYGDLNETLAKKFYSSSSTNSLKAWSDCTLKLKRNYHANKKCFPPVFKYSLEGPSVSWKVFKRLSDAIVFAKHKTNDCLVFSYEERCPDSTGQRLFLVTHPAQMWINHRQRPEHERCTYEVIRENDPCKLYFDIEFNKSLNPIKDGVQMTENFIQHIVLCMRKEYDVVVEKSDFLWLDASTPNKYSCHLILQKGGVVFQNNIQVGGFVSQCVSRIQGDDLRVKMKDDKEGFFCDEGVYTKNRNFRLFLSTKWGKSAPLLLSTSNSFNCRDDEDIFYSSLITYFRNGRGFSRVLTFVEDGPHANIRTNCNGVQRNASGCSGSSPYPIVDDFVTSYVIRDESSIGFIRRWTYSQDPHRLIYDIGRYRFCQNIGRHHASNNIMIIVDLNSRVYYQKCHDPDCKSTNYRSPIQPLPNSVIDVIQDPVDKVPDNFFDENSINFSDEDSSDFGGLSTEEEYLMAEAAHLAEERSLNSQSSNSFSCK